MPAGARTSRTPDIRPGPPTCDAVPPPTTAHGALGTDLGRERAQCRSDVADGRHQIHTPSGRAPISPHRDPAGQDLLGVGDAVGVERVPQPGLGVEVVLG